MSDDEYEYNYGSDAEYDYGSDNAMEEGGMEDEVVEIENAFYEGDDYKSENPEKAIELFCRVVELESSRDEVKWSFKALQNLVTIYCNLHRYQDMIEAYKKMLAYMSKVTRNECTDAINVILDSLSNATDPGVLSQMYEITLEALKSPNNERLWFSTNLKLARLYLDMNKYSEVERVLQVLRKSCKLPDGNDDMNKGTYLLEVYCLEIQLCSVTGNHVRMKQLYPKTVNLNAAVSDPRIMGVIREEGGKMYMSQGLWMDAYSELYESFRAYQEAGNSRAKTVLKYVVLASMLSLNDINPFAAREAKVFAEDPEILAMSELRQCLDSNDLKKFERILRNKQNKIADEPFLMKYVHPLRRRMREQVLLSMTRPFRKVSLAYLGQELQLSAEEIENILIELILDEKLNGTINQITGDLEIKREQINETDRNKIETAKRFAKVLETVSTGFASVY